MQTATATDPIARRDALAAELAAAERDAAEAEARAHELAALARRASDVDITAARQRDAEAALARARTEAEAARHASAEMADRRRAAELDALAAPGALHAATADERDAVARAIIALADALAGLEARATAQRALAREREVIGQRHGLGRGPGEVTTTVLRTWPAAEATATLRGAGRSPYAVRADLADLVSRLG